MESVFNKEYDVEKYIEKRMLEVSKLEDRQVLKEVLSHVFIELYHQIEGEYLNLENRIFNEAALDIEKFAITTGIIEKSYYDKTDEFLIPMRLSDLEERVIDTRLLLKNMKEKATFFIYTIFVQADYLVIKELSNSKRKFFGTVKTEYGEYRGTFEVRPNSTYKKYIEQLYAIFNINYLPWNTVCCPYLHKLFDVYICNIEDFDEMEEILEVVIDFEEYAKFIQYDCIPLWNITEIIEKTSAYPEACIDKINFEHIIFKHKLDSGVDYLITNTNRSISNIRRVEGDLIITCKETLPIKWTLYRLNKDTNYSTRFPLMNNKVNSNFSDYLFNHYKNCLKTKTEIARMIASLGYDQCIQFQDIEITSQKQIEETYNMDYFIIDEIRNCDSSKQYLILKFKAKDIDYYLNRDLMSYIATRIQKLFPEYHCIGKLV